MNLTRKITAITSFILAIIYFQTSAFAADCNDFSNYPDAEIEKYINTMKDTKATEIRRLFAYKKLACSDNPIYRQHAFQIGLQDTSNSLLRSTILVDLMMEKEVFVIDLFESSNLSKETQTFIEGNNSQIRFQAYKRDPSVGCITLYIHSKCGGGREIKVTGQYVEVTFSPTGLYGRFDLTSGNTLEGYVRSSRSKTGKIKAKLKLF